MKKVWCRALRPMYFTKRRVKRGFRFSIPESEARRLLEETSNFRGAFEILGPVKDDNAAEDGPRAESKPKVTTSAKPTKKTTKKAAKKK